MINLTQYLVEKFKINSKNVNKHNSADIVEDIRKHFGLDKDDEIIEYIEEWVIDNQVNEIFYYADSEVLEEGKNAGISYKIINDFNCDSKNIILCQEELEKCKKVYDKNFFTIRFNEKMLAFLSDIGGLYVTNKKILI